ncbi:MAG: malonyl-ACP O-methyltransferase BioC [Candidatus Omnitrophota bacterium]|nr:malonyl-ACP O-methyltransferase BioC [Candidatus Omnitrophota bacterium]
MDKQRIAHNFSRYAHLYDLYADVQRLAGRQLIAHLKENNYCRIIELGCGTGNYTTLLRKKFSRARIKSVDISERMLQQARQKLAGQAIDFLRADAENIDTGERFDLLTANACFQWLENPEGAFARYKTLLQPGGQILFSSFGPDTFCELAEALKSVSKEAALAAAGFLGQGKLLNLLKSNFQEAEVREEFYSESFPCLNDLLAKIKYTGARGAARNIKGNSSRRFLEELEKAYWNKFRRIKATYQVFYCRGVKER